MMLVKISNNILGRSSKKAVLVAMINIKATTASGWSGVVFVTRSPSTDAHDADYSVIRSVSPGLALTSSKKRRGVLSVTDNGVGVL